MPTIRIHAIISGKVQGVFFRSSTVQKAKALALRGWVRNQLEGTVEVLAEGDTQRIKELIQWLRQGPPAAQVDQVHWEKVAATEPLPHFVIRY